MAFTTAAKVKTHLGLSGTAHDALLTQLVAQVDALITLETNVPTDSSTPAIADEVVSSDGSTIVQTTKHPIISIVKVERRDASNDWEDYPDETHATMDFETNRIYAEYVVSGKGTRKIRLNYTAGYATADVPADLSFAATLLTAEMFNQRNMVGFTEASMLGLTQKMDPGRYRTISEILQKYKLVIVHAV